jgi:aminopeptidase YwaD
MHRNLVAVIFLIFISLGKLKGQFLSYAKPIMDTLTQPSYFGRGYVNDGVNKAATFIAKEFKKIGLQSFEKDYFQNYSFPINTITKAECIIDNKTYLAGEHFLTDPGSKSIQGNYKLIPFDYNNYTDSLLLWQKINRGFSADEVLLLKNTNDNKVFNKWIDTFIKQGFTIPMIVRTTKNKLLWTTSQEVDPFPILTFPDTLLTNADNISVNIKNQFVDNYNCKNIIGFIPGKKKNKKGYIVYTAHYDHLGMMGDKAYFPGASDNASGVSMILALANYYATNKVDYPVIFILFSGEEVGLLGSKYFVNNSLFNLDKISMLINVDIMGSAEQGITVVNGEVFKDKFNTLVNVNTANKFLPEVKIRGKAANSDHYWFSEKGVPSFFIYSNGGPGYYHDVWDKPNTLTFKNYDNVANLIINFTKEVNK